MAHVDVPKPPEADNLGLPLIAQSGGWGRAVQAQPYDPPRWLWDHRRTVEHVALTIELWS
jgi:hypothetical protein